LEQSSSKQDFPSSRYDFGSGSPGPVSWVIRASRTSKMALKSEIKTLGQLIDQAKAITQKESEVKVSQLRKTMGELNSKFPGTKILIFTESKDTLDSTVEPINPH
jgi:ERCC4-related helicase